MKCSVLHCENYFRKNNISFFKFPLDKKLRKKWLQFCGKWQSEYNCTNGKICEEHFESECLIGKIQCGLGLSRKVLLKPGAVPTIKSTHVHEQVRHRTQRSELRIRRQLVSEMLQNKENISELAQNNIAEGNTMIVEEEMELDINNNNDSNLINLKAQIKVLESQVRDLQCENLKLQTALRDKGYAYDKELRKKEFDFSELQKKFEKLELESKNIESCLKVFFTEGQLIKLKNKDRRQNWNVDDIARSITFYSASPKGYRLLRRNKFPFPAIRTLQHWAQRIDICPGILAPVIKILSATTHLSQTQKLCVLSFDEMKIRSTYTYDKPSDSTLPAVNYVQVAMLRGLVADWKQPIFYDYDCPMTKTKIQEILKSTQNMGYTIVAMVCDLGGTNRSLLSSLEVTYRQPWFLFEGRKVYVFADVPHLIKLIRNHFIDSGFVINDKFVNAAIIAELLNITAGDLSITHKISHKNLTVSRAERQKVKMATKLFSNTVAAAIQRAASLGYLNGHNWSECYELFKTTNDWFDVLNVRVPRADSRCRMHAYGLAFETQNNILDKMSSLILNMRVGRNTTLLPFQKGILQTNNALRMLFHDIKGNVAFLLTYRLNQDVLENFFGLIRARGGMHDHPDRQEFKYRLRSYLLGRNVGVLSNGANVAADDTPDLESANPSMTGLILSHFRCATQPMATDDEENLPELEYDALENLAGYVCHRLKMSGHNDENNIDSTFTWVDQVSEGGLCKPTQEIMNSFKSLEIIFRNLNGDSLLITENYLKKHIEEASSVNINMKAKQLFFRSRMYFTIRKLNRLSLRYTSKFSNNNYNKTVN
uniref:Transposase n=1 Tax=Drosophila buzzatii TaxID=7264 RepID=R4R213_DROBU|nr:transposase [Drosophila buzzatii]